LVVLQALQSIYKVFTSIKKIWREFIKSRTRNFRNEIKMLLAVNFKWKLNQISKKPKSVKSARLSVINVS